MKNILKKLNNIQKKVERMDKDGYNEHFKYNYLSETQITEYFKKLLQDECVFFQYQSEIKNILTFVNKSGVQQFLTNVNVKYAFYDTETGEKIEGEASGQGADGGDKGVYKAITGAVKYIFMKTFLIPTGDDPENEQPASPIRAANKFNIPNNNEIF